MPTAKKNLPSASFAKANCLIQSSSTLSFMGHQILDLALSENKACYRDSETDNLTLSIYAADLRAYCGRNDGSFYQAVRAAAIELAETEILLTDPETKKPKCIRLVHNAVYDDGCLTVQFNSDYEQYIRNFKKHYTKLCAKELLSFENIYALRLYELLKSESFTPKGEPEKKTFDISYGLCPLRMKLGLAEADPDAVALSIGKGNDPFLDPAVTEKLKLKYPRWSDFREHVLARAINEIKEKTNMRIRVDAQRTGRGGSVSGLVFHVSYVGANEKPNETACERNVSTVPKEPAGEKKNKEIIEKLLSAVGIKAEKDVSVIGDDAGWEVEKVRNAIGVLRNSSTRVNNKVGFMRSAIQREWENKAGSADGFGKGNAKAENGHFQNKKIHNFDERRYDYDSLEIQILNQNMLGTKETAIAYGG